MDIISEKKAEAFLMGRIRMQFMSLRILWPGSFYVLCVPGPL